MARWQLIYTTRCVDYYRCTNCMTVIRIETINNPKFDPSAYTYCPECNEKMDGD